MSKKSPLRVDQAWWTRGAGADVPIDSLGLSKRDAAERLTQFGANTFKTHRQHSLIRQFLSRFKNPLVIVLLMASAVSALTGEVTNFAIISCIVLISVSFDFVQEYRANVAAEKLKQSVLVRTTVCREGQATEVLVQEVVPGDLCLLRAGDLVPGDGLVLEARDFFVNQSLLTGEAFPVEKQAGQVSDSAIDWQEATNAVFMGTSVVGGSARVLIVKTGMHTAIGGIADSLDKPSPGTSFEAGTWRFGRLIMTLTMGMVLFVLLVNAWFHKPWLESFLFAVALAVGLTPELLPMVISVTLSRGAIRLSKRHMIVKRLTALQDLGSMDVLCTDKTGTLTEAKIQLERHVDIAGHNSPQVFELAYLNSVFQTGLKSPLDEAIFQYQTLEVAHWKKIDEVPFNFQRRCVSVLIDDGTQRWIVAKGAAEDMLHLCSHVQGEKDTHEALCADKRNHAVAQYQAMETEGLRVLGIAWRKVPRDHMTAVISDESDLVLAGFAAFLDPPKECAQAALAELKQLGVSIKIVTGDSDLVTRHLCQQLGITVEGVLTGKDILQLDAQALQRRVETSNLFCRVTPAQKERVILALKANGHVVGYMGDGINDAPSLHVADVGLSVDSAVDVAKSAADMILLEQDLNILHAGVLEGRRTFGNIMKYIMMGTSSNFGNMFSMAGAALFLPFLPMLPTQILLNNILYDVSEIPIPLDEVDAQELSEPRVLDLNFIRNFMLMIGPISSLFDFITFYLLLTVIHAQEPMFQTGWFIESLCTQVLVIFIIRTRGNPFKSRPHPLLAITSLVVVAFAIVLPLTPLGASLGFVPLPLYFYGILAAMVLTYLCVVEVAKRFFYKHMYQSIPKP